MDSETIKEFKGKAIYNPKGKAKEYSLWACNFYNGCSGGCKYCYLKKGVLATNWYDRPVLKEGLVDKDTAFSIFKKELKKNLESIKEHGLFFNFSSDPCLKETYELNWLCIDWALFANVPVIILSKQTWWVRPFIESKYYENLGGELKIGFTITGHDELEPGCSTNQERYEAIKTLKKAGYYTWTSFEPVIDIYTSKSLIRAYMAEHICDHYKIGLESGKEYDKNELQEFITSVNAFSLRRCDNTVYWKDTLLKQAGVSRRSLPSNCIKTF